MAKNYIVQFGYGLPSVNTGLSPTFISFNVVPGGATTPPGITEIPAATGLYYFTYEPAAAIAFTIDGGSTLNNVSTRYVSGSLDPVQAVDERITSLGSTLTALGNTLVFLSAGGLSLSIAIGSTADSFGSTLTDPASVFGYLKRLMEFNEGMSTFSKNGGVWNIFARSNTVGASTQLTQKVVTDSGSIITKV